MEIKFLKPAQGRVVPDPERAHKPLADEGRRVELTTYWHRRIADEDVVVVPDEQAQPADAAQADQGSA